MQICGIITVQISTVFSITDSGSLKLEFIKAAFMCKRVSKISLLYIIYIYFGGQESVIEKTADILKIKVHKFTF